MEKQPRLNLTANKRIENVSGLNVADIQEKIDKFNNSIELTTLGNAVFQDLEKHLKITGLTMLGGIPASGKTTLAIELSLQAAKNGHPVIFYSLEMSKAQILERFRKVAKEENLQSFLSSKYAKNIYIIELADFIIEFTEHEEKKIKLLDFEFSYLKTNIDSLEVSFNKKVFLIVDSLTEIPSTKDNDLMQKVDNAMLNFRYITDSTNISILVIAHANRVGQNQDFLNMSSFKGSASIEYTTDKIILLDRLGILLNKKLIPEKWQDTAQNELNNFSNEIDINDNAYILHVAKNRYGKFPSFFKYKYIANDKNLNITQCKYIDFSEEKTDPFLNDNSNFQKDKQVKPF